MSHFSSTQTSAAILNQLYLLRCVKCWACIKPEPQRITHNQKVERFNRTLEAQLAKFVDYHQRDWDEHIPYLMLAYCSAIHEYTGCTSAKVIFGKYLRLPVDLLLALGPTRGRGFELGSNDTGNLCEKLKRVHHYARNHLKLAFNSTTHKGRMA